MKTILFSITLMVMGISQNAIDQNVTAKFTYTSKSCRYDIYTAQGGGRVGCNDWDFEGTVSSSNKVTVTLYRGNNTLVRAIKSGYGVCEGSKIKREDNLSLRANATQSSRTSWELHDWTCD